MPALYVSCNTLAYRMMGARDFVLEGRKTGWLCRAVLPFYAVFAVELGAPKPADSALSVASQGLPAHRLPFAHSAPAPSSLFSQAVRSAFPSPQYRIFFSFFFVLVASPATLFPRTISLFSTVTYASDNNFALVLLVSVLHAELPPPYRSAKDRCQRGPATRSLQPSLPNPCLTKHNQTADTQA